MSTYDEIRAERESHADRGWTAEHDDLHGTHHLVEFATQYARRQDDDNPGVYSRKNLVKAASLLVAAIEAIDRHKREATR